MSIAAAACASTLLMVAGQSNALGFGLTPADLPPHLRIDPRVRIWVGGRFVTMRPGANTGTRRYPGAWGPEMEFGRRWLSDHPTGTLYVVKVTKGWTGLAEDPGELDWAPQSHELYAAATAAARAARRALGPEAETVVLWHQGERDAADPSKASSYAANFAEFRRGVLSAWAPPRSRFIAARINGTKWAASPVRRVQESFGAYDTDGFPLQADGIHLSAQGQISNGAAAYAEYRRAPPPCERQAPADAASEGHRMPNAAGVPHAGEGPSGRPSGKSGMSDTGRHDVPIRSR